MALVSIKETAQRLGVAETTVRRRIRNGEVHARQVSRPQGFVWMVELPDEVRSESNGAQPEEHHTEDCAGLRELVETLKEELARKNTQIEQLHVLLQQQAVALPAPRENRPWWRLW